MTKTWTRKPLVCGNWKMHKTVGETLAFVDGFLARAASFEGVEIAIAPPFTALHAAGKRLAGTRVRLASQNVHHEARGAFTGEISVDMLKDAGCVYVIVGHSERRSLFAESDEACGKKVAAVASGGLLAILCVGETLAERDAGATLEVIARQVTAGLSNVDGAQASGIVVAYEPVWAIGTGRTATGDQAQEVHAHIRGVARRRFGDGFAAGLRILYGGSVKPENARGLFDQPDIDGGLIGGASLDIAGFSDICSAPVGR